MTISYLFSNSFVVNSILFHAPSFLRWQESLTCLHNYFIKYHEHRRQYEDYDYHTDQCSSRHQDTQGTDHINVGVKSYTDRCCEEAQRTYHDRLCGYAVRSCDGIVFICSVVTLSLITSCHKNCIVYGGSKLNGSDYDGCHEWQLSSHVVWNTHIDENRELNNAYQDDRQ